MAEKNEGKRSEVATQIGKNLTKLRLVMGWTQAKMATETGIAEPTMMNYLKGKKAPTIEYLLNICTLEEIKKKGLFFDIRDLLSSSFDPELALRARKGVAEPARDALFHDDFIGCYLCYFFDQSKPVHDLDEKTTRELRYGVLSVYDDYNSVTAEKKMRVFAAFFKEAELGVATDVKRGIDEIYERYSNAGERNEPLANYYHSLRDQVGVYEGEVTFSHLHAFVSIGSPVYNDSALMIMYSPQKRTDSDYLGGIGSVTSVAHGTMHMPTAQKIILSRHEIKCSAEEIADHLSLTSAPITQTQEAEAIVEMCEKLYGDENGLFRFLDKNDRASIIGGRLLQLVRNYIEKTVCCVGSVSREEDQRVYSLIKRYAET